MEEIITNNPQLSTITHYKKVFIQLHKSQRNFVVFSCAAQFSSHRTSRDPHLILSSSDTSWWTLSQEGHLISFGWLCRLSSIFASFTNSRFLILFSSWNFPFLFLPFQPWADFIRKWYFGLSNSLSSFHYCNILYAQNCYNWL